MQSARMQPCNLDFYRSAFLIVREEQTNIGRWLSVRHATWCNDASLQHMQRLDLFPENCSMQYASIMTEIVVL